MRVEKLSLRNFRNIAECELTPAADLNFLVGQNGQGKTSFLEALGYLATLRSFRGAKSADVVRRGSEFGEIQAKLSAEAWNTELKLTFKMTDQEAHKATKTAFINGKSFHNSTQYLSQRFGQYQLGFHAVVFNPSDHDLVRGEPAIRRAYLDRVLAAEDVRYLKNLQKYQRILQQRNAILKDSVRTTQSQKDLLIGFTEPLSQYGAYLTSRRLEYLTRVAERLNDLAHQIAPTQPRLRLFYTSHWLPEIRGLSLSNAYLAGGSLPSEWADFSGHEALPSLEIIEQAFWKKLTSLESAEWRSGHTLVGPHRDDWAFFLGAEPLKGHGSQGEVRSSLLALKLSEIELFRQATGHRPLFLLDDFSSELDRERRSFLLQFLRETDLQVFVTTTEETFFAGKRFQVAGGNLITDPKESNFDPDQQRLLRR